MIGLDLAVARARAAVLGRVSVPDSFGGSGVLPVPHRPDGQRPALPSLGNLAAVTIREAASVVPMVQVMTSTPERLEGASWPSCEAVAGSSALTRGTSRVFGVLHRLACAVARARGYSVLPDTVTFHLPASLLCLGVGVSRATLYRRLPELVEAGLLAHGGQAQKVRDMGLYGGCLWAVKVSVGEIVPRIRREDWKHQFRDFTADIDAGRTVKALMSNLRQLHPDEVGNVVQDSIKQWAVSPGNISGPLSVDVSGAVAGLDNVQDVREMAYRLGSLVNVHPDKRAELVGRTASTLARLLGDPHSRKWYCKLLWEALKAEQEGRGGLGSLSAALARLEADRQEWDGLRNPAALLVSRLKSVA